MTAREDEPLGATGTTAGLQAKVTLRRAWFEAHPNQPIPEGREQVERLFAAIEEEAVRTYLRLSPFHPATPEGQRPDAPWTGDPADYDGDEGR